MDKGICQRHFYNHVLNFCYTETITHFYNLLRWSRRFLWT